MKLRRKKIAILVAIFLMLASVMCGCEDIKPETAVTADVVADTPPVKSAYPVSFGNETFESSPLTVVSLSPALTEIMTELGLSDRLVGVSDYCENYIGVPTVGSPANPDIDAIIELAPELVITQSPIASTDIVKLDKAGIRVWQLDLPSSFSYLCEEYIMISMAFYGAIDSEDIVLSALSEIDGVMKTVQDAGIGIRFIIVYSEAGGEYVCSAGDDIASDMLSEFGTNLIDAGDESAAVILDAEELSLLSPDVVFADISISESELSDTFYETGVECVYLYIDTDEFLKPTAKLSSLMEYCLAALS